MAFGVTPRDNGTIPISSVYVPGVGLVALQGATPGAVDGSGNTSTTATMSIASPPAVNAFQASVNAFTEMRVSEEPTCLFFDSFGTGTLDANNWKTPVASGGGVAASNNFTFTNLGTGTTANGYSYLESVPSLRPAGGALYHLLLVTIEQPVIANSYRFWGIGVSPATPTAAIPLTDGIGFEIATTGKMYAVVYNTSVRYAVQDLSASTGNGKQPLDGQPHLYGLYFRGDRTYFTLDGQDTIIASAINFPATVSDLQPLKATAIAGSTPPASSALLTLGVVLSYDMARGNFQISDPTYPFRRAAVDALGNLSTGNNLYNGVAFEQQRGNFYTTLITAVGVTTTQTTADQTNYNGRGLILILDMTVIGTGSVQITIQGKDGASGKYYTILTGTTITTNSTNIYRVYPGLTAIASTTVTDILPRVWRLIVTANNANATTYTVGASIIL